MSKRTLLVLWSIIFPLASANHEPGHTSGPELLTFDELVTLSDTDQPGAPLVEKLDRLLGTPIVSNQAAAAGAQPHRPSVERLGPVLRVAEWNIERGLNFDLIKLALSDPDGFNKLRSNAGRRPQTSNRRSISNSAPCATPT